MIFRRLFISVLILTAFVSQAVAQNSDSSTVTVDQLFSSREFSAQSLGPVRWLDDESGYTRLEPSAKAKEARDIVRYDAESGRRDVLVAAERLVPSGASGPLSVEDYYWSTGGKL